jgi:hypothetical protein
MPRREKFSIEERQEHARETFLKKQEESRKKVSKLYCTLIYKLAKKSCITFLWIAQFIIIDWLLPYNEIPDKIKDGYQIRESGTSGHSVKETYVNISTRQSKNLTLLLDYESKEPQINDSIIVLKSSLLHEAKKVKDLNKNETYLVSSSLTYILLPVIIIFSILSILFLFIKNIEVKVFFYFMFIANVAIIILLVSYYFRINYNWI